MNGVITIDGRMTEKQKASTVAHERGHLKQIRTGVLRFDTNNYYYKPKLSYGFGLKKITNNALINLEYAIPYTAPINEAKVHIKWLTRL